MANITGEPSSRVPFLDRFLASFRTPEPDAEETRGVPGTPIFGGYVAAVEKNPLLTGRQRWLTYADLMANVSIIAASCRYFLNLTARATWKFEPPEEGGAEAVRLAELVEEMLTSMETPWHRIVRRAAMFRFHGFSVQEWTAVRREDGALGLLDVAPRPQVTIERWDTDATGRVHGIVQQSPQTGFEIYLPRAKVLYLVDDSLSDAPEGLGLFRHLVAPAFRLARYEILEAYGYETDLRGIPLGRAPLAALAEAVKEGRISAAEQRAAVGQLEGFIKKHIKNPALGLMLDSATYRNLDDAASPSGIRLWDLELLIGNHSSSSEAVAKAIERINLELARVMGTEGLLLGGDGRGSLALSRDKSHNFALIIDSTLQELADAVRRDLVARLFEINGWDPALMPAVRTEATRYRNVEEITRAIQDMAQAGAVLAPDDPAIAEVRELLGLTPPATVLSELGAGLPGAGNDPPDLPAPGGGFGGGGGGAP